MTTFGLLAGSWNSPAPGENSPCCSYRERSHPDVEQGGDTGSRDCQRIEPESDTRAEFLGKDARATFGADDGSREPEIKRCKVCGRVGCWLD